MNLRLEKSLNEEELAWRCKKRQPSAQKLLFQRYSSKMLGVCIRYVKNRGAAEDIMCDGFVKVYEKISQFKGKGSLEGWIRKIMVNESLSYLRKNSFMSVETDLGQIREKPDIDSLQSTLHAQDLLRLIGELPVGYRTIFNLYAIEGYSHREIGQMLGIDEGTSKSQLSRARRMLQNKLLKIENQTATKTG